MSRISDLAGFTTALSTTEDLSVGIITASSFSGDGSGLTGVASTDNIQTATSAKFLSNVNVSGITTLTTLQVTGLTTVGVVTGGTSISAGVYYGDGSALTGIDASTLKSGSDVKAQAVSTGVVNTGVLTGTTLSATNAVFDGNVTVGGTINLSRCLPTWMCWALVHSNRAYRSLLTVLTSPVLSLLVYLPLRVER